MKKNKFLLIFVLLLYFGLLNVSWGQISITSLPYSPAVTTFDSFNPTDASAFTSTIPAGWSGTSSGTAAYKGRGNGSSNAGGYWAYGSGSEYSLGALRSGTPGNITYTVSYTNNSGGTITSLTFSWDYEQWRYANTSGWDCSGTGQLSGNSTLNAKDFTGSASGTNGSVTVTPVTSFTLSGLSIANGQTFGISWITTDGTSSDNGVAIDKFSISASGSPPTMTVNPTSLSGFSYSQGSGPSTAKTSILNGANLNPSSGNITITGSTNYEVSTNGSTFSSSQTISYTSSALTNSTIYIRLKAGLSSGAYNNENVVVSGGGITSQNITCSGKVLSAEPVTQATNITSGSVSTASMVISWTNGSGTNRAVFMKEGVQGTITNPTDSVSYSASANWSSKGTQLGSSGYYCIYNGSGNSVSLSNLTTNTNYWIQVFEYNGSGVYTNYLTVTAIRNPNNFYVMPTTQALNITFPTVASNSITANWTNGNGSKRIVIVNTNNSFTNPSNGTDPTANPVFSGSGEQVVFNGTGNTVAVTNLSAGTTYWFRVYECNGSGTYTVYNTNTATQNPNNQYTTVAAYIWTGGAGDFNWNTAGNWSPSRTSVSSSDNLTFDNTGTITVNNVQSESIDKLTISGNTNLILNPLSAVTLTIGTSINVASSSILNLGSNLNISLNSGVPMNVNGTLLCGTSTVSGNGNFILSSVGTLGIGSVSGLSGNITSTGTKTLDSQASYVFNGIGNIQNTTGLPGAVGSLTINNSSGVSLQNNLSVYGTLTLTSGAFNLNGHNLSLNGDFSITSGSIGGNSSSNLTLNVTAGTSGTLNFSSGSALNNFTLNSIGSTITFSSDLTIYGTMSLVNGKVDLLDNILTLYSTGSLSENTNSVIKSSTGNGYITTSISLTNPSGDNCRGIGVTITSLSDLGNTTIERHFDPQTGNGNTGIKRWYNISPANNSGLNATLILKYDQSELNSIPEDNLDGFKSTDSGITWEEIIGTLNKTNRIYTIAGINSFSRWTLGDKDNTLPVKLNSFLSDVTERSVVLKWITGEEINNSGFDIERANANDKTKWDKIGFVKGKGTLNTSSNYSFEDNMINSGKYLYRLKQIDFNGNFHYFNLESVIEIKAPNKPELSQNYPNPFNPITKINYGLPKDGKVKLVIYDIRGCEIKTLVDNEFKTAGRYTVEFNGSQFSSGVYFYRIHVDLGTGYTEQKKMILVK